MANDDWPPCRLVSHNNDTHSLCFDAFDATADVFEEAGYDGGGYGWHGVVEALVRMKAPKIKKKVNYDPEASMFVAHGKDLEALKQVAQLIRQALDDHELLRQAIEKADPDVMD